MNRSRTALLIFFLLLFFGLCGWLIYSYAQTRTQSFVAGIPPEDIRNFLLPKTIDLGQMRPPALRPLDPTRYGSLTSDISIVEFGDYQCESCKSMESIVRKVIPAYNGKVRLVWRDLPIIDAHPQALNAAIFARCAGLQKRFWEAHDALFDAETLSETTYLSIGASLKLDIDTLNACRKDPDIKAAIEEDMKTARNDGVNTAPFFFIGTKAVSGAMTETELHETIQSFLAS